MEQNKQQTNHIGKGNKMITAIDWLIDWMGKSQYFIGNDLLQAVEQAKAIEKEQIKAAYNQGYTDVEHDCCPTIGPDVSLFSNAEQYYNETYGDDTRQPV